MDSSGESPSPEAPALPPAEESGDSDLDLPVAPAEAGHRDDDAESCTDISEHYGEDQTAMPWPKCFASLVCGRSPAEEAEQNRLFWEICLATGYP
ncbi:hypothetical protein KSP40_PGU019262 [Platanthera guangdongensis]|uniref:Uncharacterized protein n=1 Tax=Platanthera guangdongensis TaxID=2320717 RepID=A0ABR2M7E1_9ASPA